MNLRRWLAAGLAASAAAVPAAAGAMEGGPGAAGQRCTATKDVRFGDRSDGGENFVSPRRLTIRAGACVRWNWTGMLDHQVDGGAFRSKVRIAPFSYRKRFTRPRERRLRIVCSLHPGDMTLSLRVLPRRS